MGVKLSEATPTPALVTVKVKALEADAPGLTTVTEAVPAVVTSEAWTTAVTSVEDTNVVVRAEPFQSTAAPDTKPVPVTVKVNAALPARTEDGERLVRCAAVAVSVKLPLLVAVPPGVVTVMWPAPAPVGAWQVICVEEFVV